VNQYDDDPYYGDQGDLQGHLSIVTPPAAEPITLAQAKLHLRVDTSLTAEDSLITAMISAARDRAEQETGRAIPTQTWKLQLDRFPCDEIDVPMPPLQSVTSIQYLDALTGTLTTLAQANYVVSSYTHDRGRITPAYGIVWPVSRLQADSVTVTFVAGYATVPQSITEAIYLMVGQWYDMARSGVTEGFRQVEIPLAASRLLGAYRTRSLTME
jgi:uncharacterized phiE125 gp8 family phage protein